MMPVWWKMFFIELTIMGEEYFYTYWNLQKNISALTNIGGSEQFIGKQKVIKSILSWHDNRS